MIMNQEVNKLHVAQVILGQMFAHFAFRDRPLLLASVL